MEVKMCDGCSKVVSAREISKTRQSYVRKVGLPNMSIGPVINMEGSYEFCEDCC